MPFSERSTRKKTPASLQPFARMNDIAGVSVRRAKTKSPRNEPAMWPMIQICRQSFGLKIDENERRRSMRKREKSAKERFLELVRRRSVVEERNWRRLLNLYEHTESAYQHLFDELMSLRQVSGEFTA